MSNNEQKTIPADSPHAPLFLGTPADKGIVVFIHGFMGSPRHFDKLIDAAHSRGFAVAALLLPAHGGSAKDFGAGRFELWQGHVDSEVERINRDYENIWLVGHSMGGLLAINAATKHGGSVRGIFEIAPAFKVGMFSANGMMIRLKQSFSHESDRIKAAYHRVCSVSSSPGRAVHMLRQTFQLRRLIKAATGNLKDVRVPVFAIFSKNDELTSIKSLKILKSGLAGASFEHLLLSDSLHSYYCEQEWAMIEQSFLDFITADMYTNIV